MADENISDAQRKLTAAMQQQADDYARYGQMQVTTAEQLRDAQFQAATGFKNLSAAGGLAGKAIGAVAAAGIASAQAMYQGKKGMGAFNSSLDSLSEAATIAGAALTLLIPGGIVMKAIIGGLTMAATAAIAYTKAANDMSDKLYKSYSGLAKSGGAAADGMTGVFRDAKKLGLSMDELDSMVALIAANSEDLAMFAGTVSEGREKLADMSKAMEGSRAEFFKMGLSQTDINEGLGDYLRVVTRTGRAQTMTTEQLASSARNYITEQDQLAKITGISVKQQQANIEKALANEMFQSKIRSLEAEGKTKAADQLKKLNAYYSQMGEESAKGFQDSVNGNLRSKEAQKLNLSSQGEVLRSTQEVIAGNLTAAQAFDNVAGQIKLTEESIGRTQAAFGTTADSNLKYSEQVNFANAAIGKSREQLEKNTADIIAKQKAGTDAITDAQGAMVKTQQEINEKLERDVLKGIPNAQANMKKLANVTDTLADGFTNVSGALNGTLGFFARLGADQKGGPHGGAPTAGRYGSMAAPAAAGGGGAPAAAPVPAAAPPKPVGPESGPKAPAAPAPVPAAPAPASPAPVPAAAPPTRRRDRPAMPPPSGGGAAEPAGGGAAEPVSKGGGGGKTQPGGPLPTPAAPAGGGGAADMDSIRKNIIAHEGAFRYPYKDTKGLWTIGVGHLIGNGKTLPAEYEAYKNNGPAIGSGSKNNNTTPAISEADMYAMLDKDIASHSAGAEQNTKNFKDMTTAGKSAFVDLAFNMGNYWIKEKGFVSLDAALGRKDNDGISKSLINSDWYKQVGKRGPAVVGLAAQAFARDGGVFDGPSSGYPATLHGTEAVIPLKNGAVPVSLNASEVFSSLNHEITNIVKGIVEQSVANNATTVKLVADEFKSALSQMNQTKTDQGDRGMTEMLDMLSELVAATKSSNDIQSKILRSAN